MLDGNSDYLTVAAHADFNFSASSFCIDHWVRFNSVASSLQTLFASTVTGFGLLMRFDTDGKIHLYLSSDGISVDIADAVAGTKDDFAADTWYHIALTWDGANYRVFVDGTIDITVASSTGLYGTIGVKVGAWTTTDYYLNGWTDEVRVSKGTARWTANFTPPTREYYKEQAMSGYFNV